jgi:hypothetical protein
MIKLSGFEGHQSVGNTAPQRDNRDKEVHTSTPWKPILSQFD